jgi:orotate phosphoribosyltransferase
VGNWLKLIPHWTKLRMKKKLIKAIRKRALSYGKFELASGEISDYYIDLSKVISTSAGLKLIASCIIDEVNWEEVTTVGGPAYGAIPLVSSVLSIIPFKRNWFFVRKEPKKYGKKELIEGILEENDQVLLLEDVTTTGGSLLKVIEEVQKIAKVVQIISIIDRNQGACKLFEDRGIPFNPILNISQIL